MFSLLFYGKIIEAARDITKCMYHRENMSSRFSSNSEADASELLENPEELFLHYC